MFSMLFPQFCCRSRQKFSKLPSQKQGWISRYHWTIKELCCKCLADTKGQLEQNLTTPSMVNLSTKGNNNSIQFQKNNLKHFGTPQNVSRKFCVGPHLFPQPMRLNICPRPSKPEPNICFCLFNLRVFFHLNSSENTWGLYSSWRPSPAIAMMASNLFCPLLTLVYIKMSEALRFRCVFTTKFITVSYRHIVSKVNTPLVKLSEDHSSLPPGGSRVSHKADTTKNAHMFLTCACKRAIASSAKVSATARRASVISV